jgi:hypothetical protein
MDELEKKTVVELKDMAKKAGIRGYSKMRKHDLIESLKEILLEGKKTRRRRKVTGKQKNVSRVASETLSSAGAPSTLEEKMPDARFVAVEDRAKAVEKKAVEEVLPASHPGERVVVVPRDPEWVFIYWETSEQAWEKARKDFRGGRSVLKLYHGETQPSTVLVRAEVGLKQGKFYARVPRSGGMVRAEVGIEKEDGSFYPVLISQVVPTIGSGQRGGEVRFMTVPFEVPLKELKERGSLVPSGQGAQSGQILTEKEFRRIYGDLPSSYRK